MFLKEEFSED